MASWLERYEAFLVKNCAQISSIESSLRTLTFILPGRFQNVEIATEGLYSTLQVLGLYHDKIIAKEAKKLVAGDVTLKPSPHHRYTEFYVERKKLYRTLALTIQLTRYTELLWEMVGRSRSEKARWNTVLGIESFKAVLRLALMAYSRRPVLSPPMPEREVDPAKFNESQEEDPFAALQPVKKTEWVLPRRGQKISYVDRGGSVEEFLMERVLTPEDVKSPQDLVHTLDNVRVLLAEVAYILRPLLYAAMMYWQARRSDRGKKVNRWIPWVIGFVIEYVARRQMLRAYQDNLPGGLRSMTKLEAEELQKRGMAMWWWTLRGAMYDGVTRPFINGFLAKTSWVPGMGLVGSVVEDYLYLLDNYHFASSSL
ncbi:hypothetical protein TRVA0_008S03048 [Trichomonascus vanleenenianus]|uniref:peroxisomal membrane protein PEX16 n=1 Tax=Trichomonascus vanleenenianus TaxID=2268995 RepID=UPI003ECA4DCC